MSDSNRIGCLPVAIGLLVFLCGIPWVLLKIDPDFYEALLPSLVSSPEPTVRSELELGPGLAAELSQDACANVPFYLLPIAGLPKTVRVVWTDAGDEYGYTVLSCRTGEVVEDRPL